MKKITAICLLNLLLGVSAGELALASADAGIAIGEKDFSVELYYGTELDYKTGAAFQVNQPEEELYTLMSFVVGNYDVLRASALQVRADLMPPDDDETNDYILLQYMDNHSCKDSCVERIDVEKSAAISMIEYLCRVVALQCDSKQIGSIAIYDCNEENCDGWLRYGNNVWTENPKYSLTPISASTKKYVVTRKNVHMYFRKLQ